jgi:hypothetical protein
MRTVSEIGKKICYITFAYYVENVLQLLGDHRFEDPQLVHVPMAHFEMY